MDLALSQFAISELADADVDADADAEAEADVDAEAEAEAEAEEGGEPSRLVVHLQGDYSQD